VGAGKLTYFNRWALESSPTLTGGRWEAHLLYQVGGGSSPTLTGGRWEVHLLQQVACGGGRYDNQHNGPMCDIQHNDTRHEH